MNVLFLSWSDGYNKNEKFSKPFGVSAVLSASARGHCYVNNCLHLGGVDLPLATPTLKTIMNPKPK